MTARVEAGIGWLGKVKGKVGEYPHPVTILIPEGEQLNLSMYSGDIQVSINANKQNTDVEVYTDLEGTPEFKHSKLSDLVFHLRQPFNVRWERGGSTFPAVTNEYSLSREGSFVEFSISGYDDYLRVVHEGSSVIERKVISS